MNHLFLNKQLFFLTYCTFELSGLRTMSWNKKNIFYLLICINESGEYQIRHTEEILYGEDGETLAHVAQKKL